MTDRAASLAARLSVREQCDLLSGINGNWTVPVERLGIGSVGMSDGPHGVCAWADCKAVNGRVDATTFPCGACLAATWNPELIVEVGRVLGTETRALGYEVLLGPCINIVRSPLGGRNFETYGEDPYLNGAIGTAWVQGLQGVGAGASLKHFACNNQETERFRGSSEVDERTLREIYLPAFETVVKEARPWTVMHAYNRINGVYCCDNRWLLKDLLRDEWGFNGVVVSDWSAIHSPYASVAAGSDLEMPGPAKYRGQLLYEAVTNWQLEREDLAAAATNILRLAERCGKLGDDERPRGQANTPAHQAVARRAAAEGITLLKNADGLLPLAGVRRVAVVGPHAAGTHAVAGGSSESHPPYAITVLDGLRAALGDAVAVEHVEGCSDLDAPLDLAETGLAIGETWRGEYFNAQNCDGEPDHIRDGGAIPRVRGRNRSPAPGIDPTRFAARFTGELRVPADGLYRFQPTADGQIKVWVNDELVVDEPDAWADVPLRANAPPTVQVEFIHDPEALQTRCWLGYGRSPDERRDERLAEAAEVARQADVAVVAVGLPWKYESESFDREHLELTGHQNELVEAVAAANPDTVVVINAGAPVTMPWLDRVKAVVLLFYPGMEGGGALGDILVGAIEPSGRLPVTFPLRLEDNPTHGNFPGSRQVHFGEGLRVGYRHYDSCDLPVLFPFGHGLSYTTFAYGELTVDDRTVRCEITNTGVRPGFEVVQLYIGQPGCAQFRPPKELKRFAKVHLEPGASTTVTFELDDRCFAWWNADVHRWQMDPGPFDLFVGSSSRDLRARATLTLP